MKRAWILWVLVMASTAAFSSDASTPTTAIDAAKPETWEAALTRSAAERAGLVKALIPVAQDEKQPADLRRAAINTIAKTDTIEARKFLLANVMLKIPIMVRSGPDERLKETPCRYALITFARDWNTAQAVLAALREKRMGDPELQALESVLRTCLTEEIAVAVADAEWSRVESIASPYAYNIKRIRDHLRAG